MFGGGHLPSTTATSLRCLLILFNYTLLSKSSAVRVVSIKLNSLSICISPELPTLTAGCIAILRHLTAIIIR
jgi:hypothetical protein